MASEPRCQALGSLQLHATLSMIDVASTPVNGAEVTEPTQ